MPGSARRVRAAYSRTLCLPCLKAGFFCFLHYRCWPLYVQLFIFNFLCICLLLFGTSFFSFHPFITFLRWLFTAAAQTSTEALLVSNRACLGLCWCRFPTPSPDRPKIAAQGRVWVFSPKTNSPLPLKGEGRGIAFLGLLGLPCSFTTGSHASNRACSGLRWCHFPTWLSKSHTGPHRGGFGFGLLAGDSEEDCL